MALSVSQRAFGDHLWLPVRTVVITLAGVHRGLSPSLGGMAVGEADMILGLTVAGVSEADATAAVFHPAPVHLVPVVLLGPGRPRLDAKERVR